MRVKILGSAAGGGFPQWNCACANCGRLLAGTLKARRARRRRLRFHSMQIYMRLIAGGIGLTQTRLEKPTTDRANAEGDRVTPASLAGEVVQPLWL